MRTPKTRLAGARATAVTVGGDRATRMLYARHYRPLVRLAALLVPDLATAVAHLRRTVIERSRSVPSAPAPAIAGVCGAASAFVAALRKLPARPRGVVVLHCFAELTEVQIAAATGISTGAVRAHIERAFALPRADLPAVA
jgi:hypothetical protein